MMSQSFLYQIHVVKQQFATLWLILLVFLCDSNSCYAQTDIPSNISQVFSENPPISPRIINGAVSNPQVNTFFVGSGYDEIYWTPDTLCGASLIHSDIFVTAAHCTGAFNYGALIFDSTTNDFTRMVPVDQQSRHPQWNFDTSLLNFDFLLYRLATPISDTDPAKPIVYNTDPGVPSDGQIVKGYGFGLTETGAISDSLRETDFVYIPNEQCLAETVSFSNVVIGDDVMCTRGTTSSTCSGDSGGPLTDTARTTLFGVISFGFGCEADLIPNGGARISAVSGWVKEQICDMSKNPPADCPSPPQRDTAAVVLVLNFIHDFYAEQTTFAIRAKGTREIVFAGPKYIPARNDQWKSEILLLPGEYIFEVYDTSGNGLQSNGLGDGSWEIMALYDGVTETRIAGGDAAFGKQQITEFVVANNGVDVQLETCLSRKDQEEAIGSAFGTNCECEGTASETVLVCRNSNNAVCSANYESCETASDCCDNLRCVNSICRARSRDPEKVKIGNGVGGAASRQNSNGTIRRRSQ